MSKSLHEIDQIFSQAQKNLEVTPSGSSWENITKRLDCIREENSNLIKRNFKRAVIIILLLACGLLLDNALLKERGQLTIASLEVYNTKGQSNFISSSKKNIAISASQTSENAVHFFNRVLTFENPSLLEKNGFLRSQDTLSLLHFQLPDYHLHLQEDNQETSLSSNAMEIRKMVTLKNKFHSYWSLNGFIAPERDNYMLDSDLKFNGGDDQRKKISNRENHEMSLSASLFLSRQFSDHLGFKVGIVYSNSVIKIAPQEIYAETNSNGNIGYKYIISSGYGFVKPVFGGSPSPGDSIKSKEAQHNLNTLSVPVMLTYRLHGKKTSLSASAGLSVNLITKSALKTEITDQQNQETVYINRLEGTKHIYGAFVADVDAGYQLGKKVSVHLQPFVRSAFTPITKNNVVKTYPYTYGMAADITLKL